MTDKQNVTKAINFEQVAMSIVPPESSHRPFPVILDVGNLWRVTNVNQSVLDHVEAKGLVLLRLVLSQGVVHVKSIKLYLFQQQ